MVQGCKVDRGRCLVESSLFGREKGRGVLFVYSWQKTMKGTKGQKGQRNVC